jgi:DNA-binding NarL/FixJ family response regulator
MSRTSQRGVASRSTEGFDADLVLVDERGSDDAVEAVLGELELDYQTVGSVGELLEREVAPAVVLLRVSETLARGVGDIFGNLERQWPHTAVVVVCTEIRPGELRTALAAGVSGVVLESQLATTLPSCLEASRSGQVCVPKLDARQVEPAALSAREKQILGLVVMGYMNSEIGRQLFVAESTVKSHLSSAFAKLGVRSRNEAVELILDPERGLGMGILELGGERVELKATAR